MASIPLKSDELFEKKTSLSESSRKKNAIFQKSIIKLDFSAYVLSQPKNFNTVFSLF